MSQIPTQARKKVWERQNNQCARCGGRGSQIHHRLRRREGGHALSILVGLCASDHQWAHANPTAAKAEGFIISVHEKDPTTIPLKSFMGLVLFDNHGNVIMLD